MNAIPSTLKVLKVSFSHNYKLHTQLYHTYQRNREWSRPPLYCQQLSATPETLHYATHLAHNWFLQQYYYYCAMLPVVSIHDATQWAIVLKSIIFISEHRYHFLHRHCQLSNLFFLVFHSTAHGDSTLPLSRSGEKQYRIDEVVGRVQSLGVQWVPFFGGVL